MTPSERELLALYPYIRRLAVSRAKPADREDFAQHIYTLALGHLHQYEPGTNMKGWLQRIARNESVTAAERASYLDKKGDIKIFARNIVGEWSRNTAAGEIDKPTVPGRVWEAIHSLWQGYRQTFVLRIVQEFSYAEIGEILGISRGTVMSRLWRVRQHFAKFGFKELAPSRRFYMRRILCALALAAVTACGSKSGATAQPGGTMRFQAVGTPVTWTATGGSITSGGVWTAPACGAATFPATYTITATTPVGVQSYTVTVAEAVTAVAVLGAKVGTETVLRPAPVTLQPGQTAQFYARVSYSCHSEYSPSTPPGF